MLQIKYKFYSLGKSLGVDLPAASTTANIMFRALKNDLGEKDFSVIAERFQKADESEGKK